MKIQVARLVAIGAGLLPLMLGTTPTAPENRLWIEGGSNIRNWSCTATSFEARTVIDSGQAAEAGAPPTAGQIKRVSVKVAVRNLKCGNGHMERDLYRALKATDPAVPSDIVGVFDGLGQRGADESRVEAEGTIAVAGVEKSVRLQITVDRLADGTVITHGSVPLLMTDFGVTPPIGLLGLIRSHNEIVVKFSVAVAR